MSSTRPYSSISCKMSGTEYLANSMPPMVCPNRREKIEAEEMLISEIVPYRKQKERDDFALVWCAQERPRKPIPVHPIFLSWFPKQLNFEINKEVVVRKLWVSNRSERSLYIHICGLWNDLVNLGAGWKCYPRTRIYLAAGLTHEVSIRACPRSASPVRYARAGLQVATAHKLDIVIGYFVVPIDVKFNNFIRPSTDGE